MRECGEACSLENIKNIILEKKSGQEILQNSELLSEMEKLYRENYPDELGFSEKEIWEVVERKKKKWKKFATSENDIVRSSPKGE